MRCLILTMLPMLAMEFCVGAFAAAEPAPAPATSTHPAGVDAVSDEVLQMGGHHQKGWLDAYLASPLSILSKDYFARFSRDPEARPSADEVLIGQDWRITLPVGAQPLVEVMAQDLADFLAQRMGVPLTIETDSGHSTSHGRIVLLDTAQGSPGIAGSFTISAQPGTVRVAGDDSAGLRDGVVRLVDLMAFRAGPILRIGEGRFTPRVTLRVGRVPLGATVRDAVFLGNNAIVIGYHSLFALSTSDAIPALVGQRDPVLLQAVARTVREARRYELKTYLHVKTSLLDHDHPAFVRDPEIRGAELNFGKPGQHALCSEHPLVKRYYAESVAGLLRETGLDGVMLIVGGEEFYHCYMRPSGCEKGSTNCPRCKPLDAETVVADLGNLLADAARAVRPDAENVLWPYGAYWAWAGDAAHTGMIEKLGRGSCLLVEPEVGEVIQKESGIAKHLWDYSIDMPAPGPRCRKQIAACAAARVPLYLKSDHEHAYEACRLPGIPCMDRWFDRTEAMLASGADGLWVFSYVYRPCFGTTGAIVGKHLYWAPAPRKEELLDRLAASVAGKTGGPAVRRAWALVSEAVGLTPELPPRYFAGPMCLGPEHPMCFDRDAELPALFYIGKAPTRKPLFDVSPTGNRPVFAQVYRRMEQLLRKAINEMDAARPMVPARCIVVFASEDLCVRWLYHTVHTTANFYESCALRDSLAALGDGHTDAANANAEARRMLIRWREVLEDEQANARDALPVLRQDIRLSQIAGYYPPNTSLLEAKLRLLHDEITTAWPALSRKWGVR
jgi:hypothetical protein